MNVTGTQQTGSSELIFAVIVKNFNIYFTAARLPALNSLSEFEVVQGFARVLNIKKTNEN